MTRLLSILLSLALFACSYRQELSADQKLYLTAKVWGFLKYYHPGVNEGKINWDRELFAIMQKLPGVNTREELSGLYVDWIDALGNVDSLRNGSETGRGKWFDKNFDLSWFRNEFFTEELTGRLIRVEQHRSRKFHFVAPGSVGQAEPANEPNYSSSQWSDPNIRLVTLFRYWNFVEYFYPYKYKMDSGWSDRLHYFIPRFIDVKTEMDFHLLIRELTVSLCDSHAFFTTDLVRSYAGNKFIPAKFVILDDKAVVYDFYDDSLARVNDVKVGDAILTVNQTPVAEVYKRNEKYINGSNEPVKKLGYAFRWIFNGPTDTVNVTVERNGVVVNKTIKRYDFSAFKSGKVPVKWKQISESVGYVNMEEIYEADLSPMMKALWDTRAIIFDFRNYPEFIIDELLGYLNPAPRPFARFIRPDLTYPGRFVWTDSVVCGKLNPSPYRGRVIVLVNDDTQSRSEYFVMAMQTIDNSITIGWQTSGADGDVVDYTFFDDKTSWITGTGVFYPDGRETQRIGIHLDVEVPLTREDITNGRDAILEKAIEVTRDTPIRH